MKNLKIGDLIQYYDNQYIVLNIVYHRYYAGGYKVNLYYLREQRLGWDNIESIRNVYRNISNEKE